MADINVLIEGKRGLWLPRCLNIILILLMVFATVTVSPAKGGLLDWFSSSLNGLYQNEDNTQSLNIVSDSEVDVNTKDGTFAGHYEFKGDSLRVTVTISGTPQVFYYKKIKQGFQSSDGAILRSREYYKKHASALALGQKASNDEEANPNLAIDEYTQAIALDPDYDVAYCSRGETESDTTGSATKPTKVDYEAAIQDFTKAMEINPSNTRALLWRSKVKKIKGDLDGAIADMKQYVQIEKNDDPDNPFIRGDEDDLSILEDEKAGQGKPQNQ